MWLPMNTKSCLYIISHLEFKSLKFVVSYYQLCSRYEPTAIIFINVTKYTKTRLQPQCCSFLLIECFGLYVMKGSGDEWSLNPLNWIFWCNLNGSLSFFIEHEQTLYTNQFFSFVYDPFTAFEWYHFAQSQHIYNMFFYEKVSTMGVMEGNLIVHDFKPELLDIKRLKNK
jgi:hypothetical protein